MPKEEGELHPYFGVSLTQEICKFSYKEMFIPPRYLFSKKPIVLIHKEIYMYNLQYRLCSEVFYVTF